jgi:hypothetical protein
VTTAQSKQFTATVTGTANSAVTWSVNGIAGGNGEVGYIDATGLYSAPSTVPTPATVDVAATSVETPSAAGHAAVTVQAPAVVSVSISPSSATVKTRRSVQFTATVSNSSNSGVQWAVNGKVGGDSSVGTISSSGRYTAPSAVPVNPKVTVSATSVADGSKSASAIVTIRR